MITAGISGIKTDDLTPAPTSPGPQAPPALAKTTRSTPRPRLSLAARRAIMLTFGLGSVLLAADIALVEINAGARVELAARLSAAALENVSADAAIAAFEPVARLLDDDMWIWITDRDGNLVTADVAAADAPFAGHLPGAASRRSIVGELGEIEVGVEQAAILGPVGWHILFGLFFLGIFAVGATRQLGGSRVEERAHALRSAIASETDGMAVWDTNQKLVTFNAHFADAGLVPPGLLRRGTTYIAFLDGLRLAGELTLMRSDRTGRRLRLVRAGAEAWDVRETFTGDGLLITRLIDDSERTRLRGEVAHLHIRVGELSDELQTQRVRGDAASRSKTLFLSQLSHSLRTPLNHIIGFADLLRHQSYGPLGDTRYLSYAGNIKQSGEALLDMLSNMLELAEFDSGQRVLAKEQIHLAELLDWTEGRYREQAKRAGINVVVERNEDVIILGDRLGLRRLIGSIVDNSLKFTPAGGSVTLAVWPSEDGVVLEFTDTGIGIASDTLTVLNTSFALSKDSRGNGIAIARAIAELSGGELQINSSPGVGTTVAVALPARPIERVHHDLHRVA
jgi:two-component system cell cycle sensor histidine kinase PleC